MTFPAIPILVGLALTAPLWAQDPPRFRVDLSDDPVDHSALRQNQDDQTTKRPWYENVEIWGHVAATYLDTGNTGYRPVGSILLREGNLFVHAQANDKVSAHLEVFFSRAGSKDDGQLFTDEIYVEFRNVIEDHPDLLNFKIGVVDIPFGEDYLRRHAVDNPMINYSAGMPYGSDEGLLAFGSLGGLDWIAAVMEGNADRGNDDDGDKAVALKLSGRPAKNVYLSGSVMRTGDSSRAPNCFAGMYIMPVGGFGAASSVGVSPSAQISAVLYEVDAKFGSGASYVLASFGQAHVHDDAPGFTRDLTWFFLEPSLQVSENCYLVARYSEFGTYDSQKGYAMNGRLTGAGFDAFGWDAKRLSRVGLGIGYHPNPNLWIKAEIGRDRYWTIDPSPFTPGSGHREYFGVEVVVGF